MPEPKIDSLGRRNHGWARPGPGRTKEYHRTVSASLDYSDYAAVKRIAKRDKRTIAETVRTFITWAIEEDGK